jgi:EmrB/QacA subfamily drug resistance transporter
MMTIDVSIVRLALPDAQNDLDLSDAAQQWIVNAYLLTMGAFAIAGGRAGDRVGRRSAFLVGVVVFVGCSVLAGVAQSGAMLVAARAGQGVGAAIMTPGTTAMVTDAFSGASLARAMGILAGIGAFGTTAGSLLGGTLVELAGWRSVFFINVPVSLVVLYLVVKDAPERRLEDPPGSDWRGLTLLVVWMTALTLALVQLPAWSTEATLALLGTAAFSLVAWLFVESRADDPLVDLKVVRGPMLGANFVAFCCPFVLSGLAVLLAIYLQVVLGYSALETGFLMLPLTVPTLLGSLASGAIASRVGSRSRVTGGMLLAAAGCFATGLGAGSTDDYTMIAPGLIAFGLGSGLALPAMTAVIMASASERERGMVSGVYNTARMLGATIGLAAMGALLASLEQDNLTSEQKRGQLTTVEATHVHNLLAGGEAKGALDSLSPKEVAETERGMKRVFDAAFATTLELASIVALLGAAVAFYVVPRLRAPPATTPPELKHSALAEA